MFDRYRMKIMKNVWVNILVPLIGYHCKITTSVRNFSTLPATKIKYYIRMDVLLNKIKTI